MRKIYFCEKAVVTATFVTVALVVAGCSDSTSTTTSSTEVIVTTSTVPQTRQNIYLVRNTGLSFETVPVEVTTTKVATNEVEEVQFALEELLALTGSELEAYNTSQGTAFESVVPTGTTLLDVRIENGVVIINLGGAIVGSSGSSSQESMLAEQLSGTALIRSSLTGVQLEIEGVSIDELWGHIDWSQPIRF